VDPKRHSVVFGICRKVPWTAALAPNGSPRMSAAARREPSMAERPLVRSVAESLRDWLHARDWCIKPQLWWAPQVPAVRGEETRV